MFSGGIASWATAKRVAATRGTDDLTLLFADTRMEDDDLYRFLDEAHASVGGELVRIEDGRTPWDVFFDVRFLGNTRADPCSRILKRELMRKWLDDNCDPADTTVYLGFDWNEAHRFDRARSHWEPWKVAAPLLEPPLYLREEWVGRLAAEGIKPPRLYALGFAHNNCGGFCIKAGHGQFALLLRQLPDRYAEHEKREQEIRDYLGKDIAILRDREGGDSTPLTLKALRERIEAGHPIDELDFGGCACMEPTA